jgi:hypothetical protein
MGASSNNVHLPTQIANEKVAAKAAAFSLMQLGVCKISRQTYFATQT